MNNVPENQNPNQPADDVKVDSKYGELNLSADSIARNQEFAREMKGRCNWCKQISPTPLEHKLCPECARKADRMLAELRAHVLPCLQNPDSPQARLLEGLYEDFGRDIRAGHVSLIDGHRLERDYQVLELTIKENKVAAHQISPFIQGQMIGRKEITNEVMAICGPCSEQDTVATAVNRLKLERDQLKEALVKIETDFDTLNGKECDMQTCGKCIRCIAQRALGWT